MNTSANLHVMSQVTMNVQILTRRNADKYQISRVLRDGYLPTGYSTQACLSLPHIRQNLTTPTSRFIIATRSRYLFSSSVANSRPSRQYSSESSPGASG